MLKITKFGGSSVASAEQFKKVKAIVESDDARRFVVVSAAGKRSSADNKITDLLYLVNAHRTYHVDCTPLLEDIKARFVEIRDTLGLSFPVEKHFEEMTEKLPRLSPEFVVSRGEWFTGQLMAEYLGLPFVDAVGVVMFHHDGSLDLERTQSRVRETVMRSGSFVMPGFYGSTIDGDIRLLDRGGGDITGSILAKCLGADMYENWTDVSGFLTADPRIVDKPRPIRRITFDEMRELSYMGASVLHEDAIFPVRDANIPIVIKNTNRPDDPGTIIRETAKAGEDEPLITGIAGKKDFLTVHIEKNHLSGSIGLVRKVLAIFERYNVSIEHIPTGIDSFGVVVNSADVRDSIYAIVSDIQREIQPDQVRVLEGLALISVVGRNMSARPGTSGRVFGVIGEEGINVRMIMQSAQEINIIFGVNNDDFDRAIRVIYDNFVATDESAN